MRAALDLLGMACGRRVAVLGDMLELGATGPELHAALAEPLARQRAERVFTVGPLMRHLHEALPAAVQGTHAPTSAELWPALAAELRAGDTVLVKGSLGSRMGLIVDALQAEDRRLRSAAEALAEG